MKILYVNPSRIESGLDAIIKDPPLSLISIAAMVPDHDAKLFDFKVEKYYEKRFRRELNRYDAVAITCMTPQIYSAVEVAEMAKEQGCTTILGGYHPTLAPDYVAKHKAVDFTVRGEGEHTFKEIIDYLDGNRNQITLKDIDGLSFKNNSDKIIHNKDRQLECNLDNFPLPRRDLLRKNVYSNLGARITTLETSRGCPHNCKFCCIIKMWKDPTQNIVYRTKSVKRVMQEIYDCDWRNDFIFFCGDNFTINVKRTKKILDTIILSGVNNKINFSCQSRADTLYRNPWLIDLMEKASMRQVFLGVESVHQQSLNSMNKKNTTPDMVKKVVKMLRDRGISVFGGVIIGFPGETKTMVRQNIHYAYSLDLDCVQFTPITAFPGTPFFDEVEKKGMITSYNYKHYDLFHPMMRTEQLTNIDLFRLVAEAYAYYYLYSDWIRKRAKEYINLFGRFNWMFKNIFRLVKQGLKSGLDMLFSQGITSSVVSDELKQMKIQEKNIMKLIEGKPLLPTQEKPILTIEQ